MNYLNKLAEAKRLANVHGAILYVTDKGRIRKQLLSNEKQLYKVEYKKGVQYVFDEKNKQTQPARAERKSTKKSASKLQDTTDASMD